MHPFSFQEHTLRSAETPGGGIAAVCKPHDTFTDFALGNKYSKMNNFGEDHRYIHLSHFLLPVLPPLRSLQEKCNSQLLYSTLLYGGEVIQVQSVGNFDGRGWISVTFHPSCRIIASNLQKWSWLHSNCTSVRV